MNSTLKILVSCVAVAALSGCAAGGRMMERSGNWLSGIDTPVTKAVGGFYQDTGKSLQGKSATTTEGKK